LDYLLLKAELSIIYLSKEFLQCNISDQLKYLIASNLSTALPETTLLTIPTTSVSVKWSFRFEEGLYLPMQHTDSGETWQVIANDN
jgi:hypothetical protein